ncbi:tetratricopeptide repeat protein 37 [Toxorhynchites rutilus septentrionalis]|uniref:tetratricopeptide repeat protein 37 n=1 Tax=Toxorhynchites rutilus septentrionalis TaxID=329112 RepID=UPI002478B39A|nr:tetratricopeptide repeat protein 37 [Toxorhynchites rutilus septentrionalis]
MSSKELKAMLKEAREAVKNKTFPCAIELCKKILKEDKENYMALLLLGASYQDTNKKEAASFLKQALVCSTDPTVALQGLANCAEINELPEIYEKLLTLTPNKFSDIHSKLLAVANQGEQIEKIVKILQQETEGELKGNDRIKSAFECLSSIFIQDQSIQAKNESLAERALEHAVVNRDDPYLHEKFKQYLKLLYRLKKNEKLVGKASLMHKQFQNDIFPLEWICKAYVEELVGRNEVQTLLEAPLDTYLDAAIKLNSESVLALAAKGIQCYRDEDWVRAELLLRKVDSLQPNWNIILNMLADVYTHLKLYGQAENICRRIKVVKSNLFIALIEDGSLEKLQEASSYRACLLDGNSDSKMLFFSTKLKILLNNLQNIEAELEQLEASDISPEMLDLLRALRCKAERDKTEAVQILQKHGNNCECLLELAKLHYDDSNIEQSFLCALKATKLEPTNAKCFYWMGKLYLHNSDLIRSRKCLEKTIFLNPFYKEAIVLLSSLYRRLSEWEANSKLLHNTITFASGANSSWAFLQLGLHHLGQQSYDEAISAFRTVIRYDVQNITSWEGLADAYLGRGSYTSAMKVFEKIVELNPVNPYPKLQLANIKNMLKQHEEAVPLFEELLANDGNYFPAIKGIAECHARLCYSFLGQRLIGKCHDHAQSAVDYFTRALKIKPNFVCLWKQLGNILDTVAELPKSKAHLQIEGSLAGVSHRRQFSLQGIKLFELASRCYSRALKMNAEDSFLWYELALNHYRQSNRFCFDENDRRKRLLSAVEFAKQSIKLEPNRWQNWNLLGAISVSKEINNLALAQHCFIEAISLDKKSAAVSWTNLGIMYLLQNSTTLANKAFGRAQQTDTTYINAWIGQAVIAEQIGQADEAMDLFRHCTQLGYHPESSLGYPHWVCSILNEEDYRRNKRYQFAIDNMHALPLSHDCITWHCEDKNGEASVEAFRFLGYLSNRLELWRTASSAFERALTGACGVERDQILCDLGYCLIKEKKYEEAVERYQQVSEATYLATIGKATAYFKAGHYQESYAEYESALNWLATSDLEKAYVLIAMSAMVYAFQGEADAKTILFQCITLPNPPIEALFSSCALGLLYSDSVLTELVIKELRKYENDLRHGHHVVYLVSQFLWGSKQKSQSLNYLISQVHKFPNRPKLRQVLAVSMLKNHRTPKKNLVAASGVAESALVLDLHDAQYNTRALDAAKWLAVASEAMRPVDERRRKILAQKAVHVDPTCKEAWSSLIRITSAK